MNMRIKRLIVPKETDADVALSVMLPCIQAAFEKEPLYNYEFKGVSERTALGDELKIGVKSRQGNISQINFSLKRDSIYHILPEYLFHPLGHYLGTNGDTDEFEKRYKEQEEQKKNALAYFKIFDELYQKLRIQNEAWLNERIFSGNQFLSDFITEGYNLNLKNPFIKSVYPCIPWLRSYRGNDEMIEMALLFAFEGKAEVKKDYREESVTMSENIPFKVDGDLDNTFCGSTFKNGEYVWKVYYHTEITSKNQLKTLKFQINEFKKFFSDWFLPIESKLMLTFGDKMANPVLSDEKSVNGVFLNYSTQLI